MPANDNDLFPPEAIEPFGAHTLVRNGLMQSNMDAQGFMILNLDTSNLVLDELPSQVAPVHQWFNSYDQGTHTFGSRQPNFSDMPTSGFGSTLTTHQQETIVRLGTISVGVWNATVLTAGKVPRLNEIREPIGNVTMAHKRITDVGDPIDPDDAVNLRLFDLLALGLNPKGAVRVATVPGDIIHRAGLQTIDGVALAALDRVLIKDEGAGKFNGIWIVQGGSWTRATDADTCAELDKASCFVLEGDENANSTWFQTSVRPAPCVLNDGPWDWQLLSRSSTLQAGDGLQLVGQTLNVLGTANRISVGSTVDIDVGYIGQASISRLGLIQEGIWEADVITGEFGGTGASNVGKTITLGGDFSTTGIAGYLDFKLSGPTTLTLPTLGTVATLAGNEAFHNKHISADQIDSGVLLITNGGTSANTAMAALANLLPDVTGHAGESLHTDGGTSGPAIFYWA